MDLANERRLAARAKELGESASAAAWPDLAVLARSGSPLVRRLAASAVGKLAGIVDSAASVDLLRPLLSDAHPQVRQYAAKALGAFGQAAEAALPDLRDLYRNPAEKDYVKRSVEAAGKTIREALRIAERQSVHRCGRCARPVDADEYARSQRAFQRTYCDPCFDEVFLKRRNWETQVELNKTIQAVNGTVVQSDGERQCALFHLERVWAENRLTAEGRLLEEMLGVAVSISSRTVCATPFSTIHFHPKFAARKALEFGSGTMQTARRNANLRIQLQGLWQGCGTAGPVHGLERGQVPGLRLDPSDQEAVRFRSFG